MASGRVIEPSWCKDQRFVSLGSGARERACQCSCSYRTRGSSIRGSCYTTLMNEPPLVPYDKQQNWHAFKGDTSPLVRLVRRESVTQNIRETPRRRRPLSAMTCTQRDANPEVVLPQNNLMISVKGKNVSWHERPLTKRLSESSITDHAIKSIHEATSEELTKISSFLSNSGPIAAPKPPLPSPEQSEDEGEDLSCEESSDEFVVDRVTSEASDIGGYVSAGQIQVDRRDEDNTCGLVNLECESQSREKNCKPSFKFTRSNERPAADRTSKKRIDFKLPTEDDNDNSESESTLLEVTDAKTIASYPVVFEDSRSHLPVGRFQAVASKVSNHRQKQRPYSAFAAVDSSVKGKTIEFVSEEALSKAKCHVSQRSVQTMMYMDYLREKGRLAREAKEDGECVCDKDSCCNDLAKSNDGSLNNRIKLPPEMHISPKPPTQRKIFQSQSQETLSTIQKETNEVKPGIEQQNPADKSNRLRDKRVASARKILLKAKQQINETKEERKQEASMIWRSITKIDSHESIGHANRSSSPEDLASRRDPVCTESGEEKADFPVDKTNVAFLSQRDDVTTKSNEDCSVSKRESTTPRQESSVRFDISENNRNLPCESLQETNDCLAAQEEQHLTKSCKTRPSSSVTRTSSPGKILRPTSAVILRHMQNKKEDSSPKPSKTGPLSLSAGSRKDKMKQEQKRRPVSAAVRRASIGASRRNSDKVISSESLDLKLDNKKVSFSIMPNSKPRTASAVRRNSAKSQSSSLKPNLKKRPISAPIGTVQTANMVSDLDIVQEEQKISDECRKILEACERKGIKISLDTLTSSGAQGKLYTNFQMTIEKFDPFKQFGELSKKHFRALMPPSERASPYHKNNRPHSSRLLSTPPSWTQS